MDPVELDQIIGRDSQLSINEKISRVFMMAADLFYTKDDIPFTDEQRFEARCISAAYGLIFIRQEENYLFEEFAENIFDYLSQGNPLHVTMKIIENMRFREGYLNQKISLYAKEIGNVLRNRESFSQDDIEYNYYPMEIVYSLYLKPLSKLDSSDRHFEEYSYELIKNGLKFLTVFPVYQELVSNLVTIATVIHKQKNG